MSDIIYINVELNQSDGEYSQPLGGTVLRTSPIVDRVGDYYVCIARLTAPLNLPCWLPEMQLAGPDDAEGAHTVYKITMVFNDGTDDQIITAPIKIKKLPNKIYTSQPSDLSNAIYSAAEVCDAINTTINKILAQATVAGYDILFTPKFIYDIQADNLDIQFTAGTAGAKTDVYFSANFYNYLAGLNTTVINLKPSASAANNYRDILLNVVDLTPTANPNITIMKNEIIGSFVDRFNAVNCIRVISTGLCQNDELSATPSIGVRVAQGPSSQTISVLQDYIPDHTPGWFQKMLLYTADSVVTGGRYVDLEGNNSINKFSVRLEWLDVWGYNHPLNSLSNSNNSSVKMAFVSKTLFRK